MTTDLNDDFKYITNSIFQKKKAQQNLNPSYEAKGKETSSERKCS